MKAKLLMINEKKVSYFDEGSGFPILLIHGWVVCKDSFIPIIEILRKKYRVIAPDLPGHGDSEELDETHNLENYIKFMNIFVGKLELNKFHIMGPSLGGTLAILYAIQNKDNVERMILLAPLFNWKHLPDMKKLKIPFIKPVIKLLSKLKFFQNKYHDHFRDYALTKRLPRIKKHIPKNQVKEVENSIQTVMEKFDNNLSRKASTEFGISALDIDLTEKVTKLENKTLILWGGNDPTLDKKHGLELNNMMPNSKYVEIENGTHDVLIEKYRDICSEIEKFIESD